MVDNGASAKADRAVVNGAASVSAVPASIPSAEPHFYREYNRGLRAAIAIAEKWRDENKVSAARARKGRNQCGMAEMLDGAAIECNAIAGAIREMIITEAPKALLHNFEPDDKYPWFCGKCGYAPHELLQHYPAKAMSASGQDPQGLEAKPASAVAESDLPIGVSHD